MKKVFLRIMKVFFFFISKGVVKHIIPAVASTNALIAGNCNCLFPYIVNCSYFRQKMIMVIIICHCCICFLSLTSCLCFRGLQIGLKVCFVEICVDSSASNIHLVCRFFTCFLFKYFFYSTSKVSADIKLPNSLKACFVALAQ